MHVEHRRTSCFVKTLVKADGGAIELGNTEVAPGNVTHLVVAGLDLAHLGRLIAEPVLDRFAVHHAEHGVEDFDGSQGAVVWTEGELARELCLALVTLALLFESPDGLVQRHALGQDELGSAELDVIIKSRPWVGPDNDTNRVGSILLHVW